MNILKYSLVTELLIDLLRYEWTTMIGFPSKNKLQVMRLICENERQGLDFQWVKLENRSEGDYRLPL